MRWLRRSKTRQLNDGKVRTRRSNWLRLYESELLCDHSVEHPRRKKSGQSPVLEVLLNDCVACTRWASDKAVAHSPNSCRLSWSRPSGSLTHSVGVRNVHHERHEAVTELSLQTIRLLAAARQP